MLSACVVTSIFDAGSGYGILCRVEFPGVRSPAPTLVTPISQVSFDHRNPIARELTAYRKHRSNMRVAARENSLETHCRDKEMPAPIALRGAIGRQVCES
jgi:hypothetical protein